MARRAVPGDALAIATVHVRSWQAAYDHVFPSEWLAGLTAEHRLPGRKRMLEEPPDRFATVVVEDAGTVVGFADVGAARDDDATEAVGEVFTFYLEPLVWGRGLGRELMDAVHSELSQLGFTAAVLWVLDNNERAIQFYEAAGWQFDGATKPDSFAGVDVAEVRMARELSVPSTPESGG